MDKITKLIRWQRVAIATLLCTTAIAGIGARLKGWHEATWREEAQRLSPMLWNLEVRHRSDEQTIRDLDERLKQYEKQFGKIELTQRGEGDSIRQFSSLPSR
ncbi:MAG: hypothetical protein V4671_23855 [Armatimonadota bacterium]